MRNYFGHSFFLKHIISKVKCILLIFIFVASVATAQNPIDDFDWFGEYILPNGFSVFISEDMTALPVKIEFVSKAGYSYQTPTTTGFLELYAEIFSETGKRAYYANPKNTNAQWHLDNFAVDFTVDASRFSLTVPPEHLYDSLEQLFFCLSAPDFSDELIEKKYNTLAQTAYTKSNSIAGFINSAIDSRVFYESPWATEHGIYPALFSEQTTEQIRKQLFKVADELYAPEACAVFISGCISKEATASFIKQMFSAWYSDSYLTKTNAKKLAAKTGTAEKSPQKKFVLHDEDFSAEMTQLVLQYTSFNSTEADVLSTVFGANNSTFKTALLSEEKLAILDAEYIDASLTDFGNLIMQTIMETSDVSPLEQAELFVNAIYKSTGNITEAEIATAQKKLFSSYATKISNIPAFMNALAEWWIKFSNSDETNDGDEILERFEAQSLSFTEFNLNDFLVAHEDDEPFIFVMINSKIYESLKAEFADAGYEEISKSSAQWYLQEKYANVIPPKYTSDEKAELPDFVTINKDMFSQTVLENGIPVTIKQNKISSTVAIAIIIEGGSLFSADNPTFNELMTEALTENIVREIRQKQRAGGIHSEAYISIGNDLLKSTVIIECQLADASECISCITNALIFGEVQPALADGLIYNRRRQKILDEASLAQQLKAKAIAHLYGDSDYEKIYNATSPVLEQTSYEDILDAYPLLLNPSRYKIIITGNCDAEKIKEDLNNSLGLLKPSVQQERKTVSPLLPRFSEDPEKISTQLEHRFFTDISADQAGPRPPVLIPTTVFNDPAQYWLPSPAPSESGFAIFNAIAYEICDRLNANAEESILTSASLEAADNAIHAAIFTIAATPSRSVADELFSKAVTSLKEDLASEDADKVIASIKAKWTIEALSVTSSNLGTTLLISDSINRNDDDSEWENPSVYLDDYTEIYRADAEKFAEIMEKYFPETAALAVYSADTPQ